MERMKANLFTKRSPAIETAMLDRLLQMLSLPSVSSKHIRSPAFLSILASSKQRQGEVLESFEERTTSRSLNFSPFLFVDLLFPPLKNY